MVLTQTNLQGSGTLNSSIKKVSSSQTRSKGQSSTGRSVTAGPSDKIVTVGSGPSSVKKVSSSRKQQMQGSLKSENKTLQHSNQSNIKIPSAQISSTIPSKSLTKKQKGLNDSQTIDDSLMESN